MDFLDFMFVPTVLFLVIVAPIWIALHYQSINRSSRSLSAEDRENVEQILVTVDKLTERIETLESLLDADHGGWRDKEEQSESQRSRS